MLGNSININKFNCNLVVLKEKLGKTSKTHHFCAKLAKLESVQATAKTYNKFFFFFFSEIANPDHTVEFQIKGRAE